MTTTTTTPQTLGWTINIVVMLGLIALVFGVYLQFGAGWAAITCGVCLLGLALLALQIYFYWSIRRVRSNNKSD
jgi:hypothetical protein